jgi:glycosyltransferase involved in cell wall biosynthesis
MQQQVNNGPRSGPEVAVLVSTYQRPWHLRRVLESLSLQSLGSDQMEIVVTDDGSTDETHHVVRDFAAKCPFPVAFTTHPHDGFHLSRCRNEGAAGSRAPYLIFLDGDCLVRPDHVSRHLEFRKPRTAVAGYCYQLDQASTERVDLEAVRSGVYAEWITPEERRRLRRADWKARWYAWIGHRSKPKLFGGNVGIWRADFERVNGYDEQFRGWGCEDDDLRLRLRADGVRIVSIAGRTQTYHLWHPRGETVPSRWRDGKNVARLCRQRRSVRCEIGLDRYLADGRPAA